MSASFPVGAVIKASNTPTNPPTKTLPRHARGMRIGLVGGTFNPPHQAHLLISLIALKRLKLDRVWWLVTPGNPLKNNTLLPPVAERMHAAQNLARQAFDVFYGFRHFHATTLAAATCVDLRFYNPKRAVHFARGCFGVFCLEDGTAIANRGTVRFQKCLGLVFVDVHCCPSGSLWFHSVKTQRCL